MVFSNFISIISLEWFYYEMTNVAWHVNFTLKIEERNRNVLKGKGNWGNEGANAKCEQMHLNWQAYLSDVCLLLLLLLPACPVHSLLSAQFPFSPPKIANPKKKQKKNKKKKTNLK